MHNTAYEYLALNFLYIPFAVDNLKDAVAGLKALNFRGFTVSMPYKQDIMRYLDKIDPVAKQIGAVNTVLHENGKLSGYNSDWIGALEALKEVTTLKDKRVLLLGAGGAARAIAYGLRKSQAKITIFNRTEKKAKNLAKVFSVQYGGTIKQVRNFDYDILINATSVGFTDDASIIEPSVLRSNKIVMDVVFDKLQTTFLRAAKEKDCPTVPGYRMLMHQALFQFNMFTGRKAPFSIMEKLLVEKLS
jgi:shikimate dehydrogenase